MSKYLLNNKGLTLLEIILAFAILTIVVTFVLALFPQAAKFNQKTDQSLTAFNIAREKLVILEQINKQSNKANLENKTFILDENELVITNLSRNYPSYSRLNLADDVLDEEDQYLMFAVDGDYTTTISLMKTADTEDGSVMHLYRTHVEVEDADGRKTGVYGYIQVPN